MKIKRQRPTLLVQQLFHHPSWTYSYLLVDTKTSDAALIDPVVEETIRDLRLINDLGVALKYILETHIHADHITGAAKIREATEAKIGISEETKIDCADILLKDEQALPLGSHTIRCLKTPGHTSGCMTYYIDGMAFTGDALFIRGSGRTDFQEGNAEILFDSVTKKIFTLPDETLVYPAHDYNGHTVSTIQEEKLYNPRLGGGKTKEEFVAIMARLNLEEPQMIDVAVPANRCCGYQADKIV